MEAVLAEPSPAGRGNHCRAASGRVRADALELAQSSFVEIEVHGLRVLVRPDSGIVRRGPWRPSSRNLPRRVAETIAGRPVDASGRTLWNWRSHHSSKLKFMGCVFSLAPTAGASGGGHGGRPRGTFPGGSGNSRDGAEMPSRHSLRIGGRSRNSIVRTRK